MNRTLSYAALAMLAVAAGCQTAKPSSQALQPTQSAALPPAPPVDTTADAQASAPIDTATPSATPVMGSEFAPGSGSGASYVPSTGGAYIVKPGDTLYHIALTHYGDGKQWKKILAANPGVDAAHLRVGQKIVLP